MNPTEHGIQNNETSTNTGCANENCDVHHITPWEQGGTTDIDNLTLLCPTCHRQTHKHPPPHKQNDP